MSAIKHFSKWFDNVMSTQALGEEDEIEAVQEIREKKVLLVLTGKEQDAKSLVYARNFSKRLKAGLDILCIMPDGVYVTMLEEHIKKMRTKNAECHVTKMEKSVHDEVIHYVQQSPDVEFVVIDSRDITESVTAREKYVHEEWRRLRCPLVVVS